MDDDTRRALRELAEIARNECVDPTELSVHRLDALLATLADPPATPVATSDDLPWPYDPDPEWCDVPAERAELRTVRAGDRWWDSDGGPWAQAVRSAMTEISAGALRWVKRHDHPARKRGPRPYVSPPRAPMSDAEINSTVAEMNASYDAADARMRGQTPADGATAMQPAADPASNRVAPSGGDSGRSAEPIAVAAGPFVAVAWLGTVHSQHAGSDRAASSLANAINRALGVRVEGLREQLTTAEKERDELRARIETAMAPLTADLPRDVMACRAIVALTKGDGQ
jgi:hypothetical protein